MSIAVFIAEKVGLRDSYWVILGTLSVLRSSAINTGQNALRSLLGTSVGFVVGAVAALGSALRQAFTQSASYLEAAVNYVTEHPDGDTQLAESLEREQTAAAAAALRLDDAFRTYLVERNSKPIPLAEVSALVIGVANLRQSADAVLGLWEGHDRRPGRQHPSARKELMLEAGLLRSWYEQLGAAFVGDATVPEATAASAASNLRLVEAIGDDLCGDDANCAATAVLLIWTRGYIESDRRLQQMLIDPARAAVLKNAAI